MTPYYFAVTAYNTQGVESGFSNEVSYTAPSTSPTPTPAPTASPTPGPVSIAGNISYCSDPSPAGIANVTLTLSGGGSGSTTSNSSGNYQFSSLIPGASYVVTPTKPAIAPGLQVVGITTVDAIAVQRHYLNLGILPPGCRLTAADVNDSTRADTTDVIAIQRFYLGLSSGLANTGKYRFTPASRAYPGVSGNQTGQDYNVLVLGDVAAPFVDQLDGPSQPEEAESNVTEVALPQVAVDRSAQTFVTEVTTATIQAEDQLVGFQGDFTFDERVIGFQSEPVEKAGLTSGNWNVSANILPGEGPIRTLRVSAISNDQTPLAGSGTLFNLNMIRTSDEPGNTALTWAQGAAQFMFINGNIQSLVPRTVVPGEVVLP